MLVEPGQQGAGLGRNVPVGARQLVQLGFIVDAAHACHHAVTGRPARPRGRRQNRPVQYLLKSGRRPAFSRETCDPNITGKSTTHLSPAVSVGQTDRMMTEAEALETLAREDPAVAADARAALRWLTSGGGLEVISQLRLQEFLWYVLPSSCRRPPGQLAVAPALGRLFTLAGLERYADACASPDTVLIITAYEISRDDGLTPTPGPRDIARRAAGHRPARLGVRHGDGGAGRLRGLRRGDRASDLVQRAEARRERLEDETGDAGRSLADQTPTRRHDSWLGKISAERIDEWAHGHPGDRARIARRIMPRLLEPPVLLGEPLPTLRWLLPAPTRAFR